jgi:hypothetical protein
VSGDGHSLEGPPVTQEDARQLLRSIAHSRRLRELWEHGKLWFVYCFQGGAPFLVRAEAREETIWFELRRMRPNEGLPGGDLQLGDTLVRPWRPSDAHLGVWGSTRAAPTTNARQVKAGGFAECSTIGILMKGYLAMTGLVFGVLAALDAWRAVEEWRELTADPVSFAAMGAVGLIAAGLSVWAWRLFRSVSM